MPAKLDDLRGLTPPARHGEPHNPFYLLLLVAGLLFVMTALAYAVVPVLEQKALDAGEPPPPSAWRDALRADGWKWLLGEVVAIVVLAFASMALDRLRTLNNEKRDGMIPPVEPKPPPEPR